jgi:ankyrin repeat protein
VACELIQAGANVNLAMNGGLTPAFWASLNGHTDVLALLLEKGADANQATNGGFTLVLAASQNGHTDALALLLEKGAYANQERMADSPLCSSPCLPETPTC